MLLSFLETMIGGRLPPARRAILVFDFDLRTGATDMKRFYSNA